jgi:glyoxylase-like metal-dependent hydrolase (beta-lactamase superfamily II)
MTDRLYFRQLLSGQDFAEGNNLADQMVNFSYLIGDLETREALIVDPAYRVSDLLGALEEDDMRCVGVLATHFHADHIGGDLMGHDIEGIAALLETLSVPIHVQAEEVELITAKTGVSTELVAHHSSDVVEVGEISVELIHTPGHTPGSQCFLVEGRLVSGDTLFLDGCGRTDFPYSDSVQMYESLTQRLAKVPDSTLLFPGHRYSPLASQAMSETREKNWVFGPQSLEQWMSVFA